ncbi:MAG TPA: DUF6084 family protein, partial [Bacillota bacterium]|nr:DUF6084 family protein [Bacillota bacterium]
QPPQRAYNPQEKERLFDLFGSPEQWGQTLRNRLWAHANVTVGAFTGSTDTVLPVPCTYDLNLAAAKYFYALEAGEVPLLFLFSGSLFYTTPEGRLQIERISWSKECGYRLPVATWRELMERLYPNCAWLYLQREVFDRLYAYRRRHRLATWEQAIEQLLEAQELEKALPNADMDLSPEELANGDAVERAPAGKDGTLGSGRDAFHLAPEPFPEVPK